MRACALQLLPGPAGAQPQINGMQTMAWAATPWCESLQHVLRLHAPHGMQCFSHTTPWPALWAPAMRQQPRRRPWPPPHRSCRCRFCGFVDEGTPDVLQPAIILSHWGLLAADSPCKAAHWVHSYEACRRLHHPGAAGSLPCYNPVKVGRPVRECMLQLAAPAMPREAVGSVSACALPSARPHGLQPGAQKGHSPRPCQTARVWQARIQPACRALHSLSPPGTLTACTAASVCQPGSSAARPRRRP